MPGQRSPRAASCARLLLLLLLLLSWPAPGSTRPSGDTHAAVAAQVRELRKRFEQLLATVRLWANRTHEDPAAVRTLTPKLRVGPSGRWHLRVSGAEVGQAVPEASRRLHRAPTTWDGTRHLLRQLGPGGRGASRMNASLSAQPQQRELHPRTRSPRRHGRSIQADDCPLGPGRCCRLHRVRASLQELGWSDWVLSPRELQVGVCVGQCPHLHRSANTHAQIKERLHRLRPDSVPAPCCVPASYEPVVLLHKTDSGVSLQTYDDVLAKACHCV